MLVHPARVSRIIITPVVRADDVDVVLVLTHAFRVLIAGVQFSRVCTRDRFDAQCRWRCPHHVPHPARVRLRLARNSFICSGPVLFTGSAGAVLAHS
jgi:hypothetical protein